MSRPKRPAFRTLPTWEKRSTVTLRDYGKQPTVAPIGKATLTAMRRDWRKWEPTVAVETRDGKVPGLSFRILPSGTEEWRLAYRIGGKLHKYKLAAASIKAARAEAESIRAQVRDGIDPQQVRQARHEQVTMRDLFGKDDDEPGWYLGTYVETASRKGGQKSGKRKAATSIRSDTSYIRNHLRPRRALMRKQVSAVTKGDLDKLAATMTDGAWRKVRGILRVCFAFVRDDLGQLSPGLTVADRTDATTSRKIERYLDAKERRAVEAVLELALTTKPKRKGYAAPSHVRAIRLASLTGMRRSEILALRWEHLDLRKKCIVLPTSKTTEHDRRIPLTPQAIAYLRRERDEQGVIAGYVCPGHHGDHSRPLDPDNVGRTWRRLRELASDGDDGVDVTDVRFHDLRHAFASDAVSAGIPLEIIGAILGHEDPRTTRRYSHMHDDAMDAALATIGARIEGT